jgi:tetratricopeptide (TPR) repeat protein
MVFHISKFRGSIKLMMNFMAGKKILHLKLIIILLFISIIPPIFADNLSGKDVTEVTLNAIGGNKNPDILSNNSFTDITTLQTLKVRGMEFFDQGKFDLALNSFEKAEELQPQDPEIKYFLGITHFMLGNMSNAEELLNHTLTHNPDPSAFFYHGLSAYALTNYNQSIISFQRYLDLQPEDSYAWFNLGQAYEETDRFDDAIQAYQSAVSIDPEYAKPWFFIGTLYYSHGYHQNAKEAILNYTRMMPEDDTGWFFLSSLYFQSGQKNESIAAMQKSISLKPDEPLYKKYLSQYEQNMSEKNFSIVNILYAPLSPTISIFAVLFLLCLFGYRR